MGRRTETQHGGGEREMRWGEGEWTSMKGVVVESSDRSFFTRLQRMMYGVCLFFIY